MDCVSLWELQNDWKEVPFISKLADFGFSAHEAQIMVISGWTKGWQAPEIDSILDENNGGKITVAEYYQADMYSLGLVMWSTFCNSGKTLEDNTKHDASARAMEAMEAQEDVPPPLKCTVSYALDWPLCYEPLERPSDPASLLFDRSESYYIWYANDKFSFHEY